MSVRHALANAFVASEPGDHVWRGEIGIEGPSVTVDVRTTGDPPYVHARADVLELPELTAAAARTLLIENGELVLGRFSHVRRRRADRARDHGRLDDGAGRGAGLGVGGRLGRVGIWRADPRAAGGGHPSPAAADSRGAPARRGLRARVDDQARAEVSRGELRRLRAPPRVGLPWAVRQRPGVRRRAAGAGRLDRGARVLTGAVGHRSDATSSRFTCSASRPPPRSGRSCTCPPVARCGSSTWCSATTST